MLNSGIHKDNISIMWQIYTVRVTRLDFKNDHNFTGITMTMFLISGTTSEFLLEKLQYC